ncbi:MFS transporter [Vallitaleaceae bacterium 9-2]
MDYVINTDTKNMVSNKERFGYSLGDVASNLTFTLVTTYLMFFYTDVVGLAPAVVATLFLVARIWDAINDPIMGIVVDKTDTKWGKCRPWFLWLAIPYGIIAILTFTVPDLSMNGKIIYAYVTYIGLGMIYTGINIPYSAILPSLTSNVQERTEVNAVRMIMAMIGGLIVNMLTMPMVNALGNGNNEKGFQMTMIIFASIAVVLFLITFASTKERVNFKQDKKQTVRDGFKAIKGNLPWLISLLINFVFWVGMTMKTGTIVYYMIYNIGREDMIPLVMLSITAGMLPAIALSPALSKLVKGKRNTMIVGNIIAIIGTLIMFAAGTNNIGLLIAGNVIGSFGVGFTAGVLFAVMADTVDYGEWKSGIRAQGLLYAASSFGVKLGMGIGGALSAAILGYVGYIAGTQQTEAALAGIRFNIIWMPIIAYIVAIVLLLFYKLDKEQDQMQYELAQRRMAHEA